MTREEQIQDHFKVIVSKESNKTQKEISIFWLSKYATVNEVVNLIKSYHETTNTKR